jgi:N6-adenosine-specific RNA methylase IME4/ParB-like chromosome segregation protein Spo0J
MSTPETTVAAPEERIGNHKVHSAAMLLPLIQDEEFDALVEDIRAHGLHEPIWLHAEDGSIVDGRNRYRACLKAGVEPRFRTLDGQESVVEFVMSANVTRRHLNETQKALLANTVEPLLAAEARQRQREHGGTAPGKTKTLSISGCSVSQGKSAHFAAKLAGVSQATVERAKKLLQAAKQDAQAKALLTEAEAGRTTVVHALRILQKAAVTEAAKLPSNKYRVIYADPPWKYGDQLTEAYGGTEYHYPAMSIAELRALPVAGLAETNAVLFLWVTAPLLKDAFSVIEAWGFEYKTQFVWDKVSHNMGHYSSVRHENLLVAVRGSCTPDVPKLYDSVVSIERTTHSRKPLEFRRMIETLYPFGRRIELFAREKVEGWEAWGNQHDATAAPEGAA